MTSIIVVEPHAILRMGIVQLLSNVEPDLTLEGCDYSSLSKPSAENRQSDLALLSVCVSEDVDNLIGATQRAYGPKAIILLSENPGAALLTRPLPSLVAGHIPKNAAPEVLQASTRLVLAGGTCFPPSHHWATQQTDSHMAMPQEPPPWINTGPAQRCARKTCEESEMLGLTPRQYEVLILLARGYPMKMVGRHLNISVATAKAHTETLYQRLNVHNRNAAVYAAVSRGAKLGWTSIGGNPDFAQEA
ncbi:MAG TPA: response regulator transcription factor [Eoetvoesiella sp.]|uniref:response regulator transcription factor n=1 Tax=Eoetvoesiella sp. TaxID=1966355 RepID=UPI002BA57C81|nr:response regulator transcription factor [Eoetvoesiella sp.]HWK62809.1 response regulator transcription factor [Eoetvoesiella sp.]